MSKKKNQHSVPKKRRNVAAGLGVAAGLAAATLVTKKARAASCAPGSGSGGTYTITKPSSSVAHIVISLDNGDSYEANLADASSISAVSGNVGTWAVYCW